MKNHIVLPNAEPFFKPGNRVGCLLIHGFTGSPSAMRPLGEKLSEKGYSVLAIRLPGHGTRIEDLHRVHLDDWLAAVEDGLNILNGTADQIFMMGQSMGGVLTLWAASRYPITGFVALSTPYPKEDKRRYLQIRLLSLFRKEFPKPQSPEEKRITEQGNVAYSKYSSEAIMQALKMIREMETNLAYINIPALLIQSRKDSVVDEESMDAIYEEISSKDKKRVWLENSGHVITLDQDREIVFKEVIAFIQRVSGAI